MPNCIVAQSGGPSSVINATVAGIVKANQLNPLYEHVYGGLNVSREFCRNALSI